MNRFNFLRRISMALAVIVSFSMSMVLAMVGGAAGTVAGGAAGTAGAAVGAKTAPVAEHAMHHEHPGLLKKGSGINGQLTVAELKALPAGTRVTIKSAANGKWLECPGREILPQYVNSNNWATFTSTDPTHPSSQFTLLKEGNFVGFQAITGNNLQSVPTDPTRQATKEIVLAVTVDQPANPMYVVRAQNKNFQLWEQWEVVQKGANIGLMSRATAGPGTGLLCCLGDVVRTHQNTEDNVKLEIYVVEEPVEHEHLYPGTKVAILSLETNKYLEVPGKEADPKWPTYTADKCDSPNAQFEILRDGEWVGFKASNGNNLASIPPTGGNSPWVISAENQHFDVWEQFIVSGHYIFSRSTGGAINNRWPGGHVRTHGQEEAGWMPCAKIPTARVHIEVLANMPADFEEEAGEADCVACGSLKGELETWSIHEGKLYRYDHYSMAEDPWDVVEAKTEAGVALEPLKWVSVSSDGVMCVLDGKGKAYSYNFTTKKFKALPVGTGNEALVLDIISVGNAKDIWAVDSTKQTIYQNTDKGWVVRAPTDGIFVAAGVDGTVVGINEQGKVFLYKGDNKWEVIPNVTMDRVAVATKDIIYGVEDSVIHKYTNGKWEELKGKDGKDANGFDEIAVNAAGTIFVTDIDGDTYHKGDAGAKVTKAAAVKTPAEVAAAKKVSAAKTPAEKAAAQKEVAAAKKAAAAKAPAKVAAKPATPGVIQPPATAAAVTVQKVAAKAPAKGVTRAQAKKSGKVDVKKAKATAKTKKIDTAKKSTVAKPKTAKKAASKAKTKPSPKAKQKVKAATKKGAKPAAKPAAKAAAKPAAKAAAKPAAKPAAKATAKPAAKKSE